MRPRRQILFPPFRLDYGTERLWRDGRDIHLRSKTFAVLRHLAEHPGELITKDELLKAVWPDTYVSDVCRWSASGNCAKRWKTTPRRRGLLRPCTGGGIGLLEK